MKKIIILKLSLMGVIMLSIWLMQQHGETLHSIGEILWIFIVVLAAVIALIVAISVLIGLLISIFIK